MNRAQGIVIWPDKFLAQTEHLSEGELGIYTRMLFRIWLFTPTQFSFEDTESNWKELTGLEGSDRIEEIKKKFLNKLHPLFMRSHNRHGVYYIQKGLRASLQKIRQKSEQNSRNARKRWHSKTYENANAHDDGMRTHAFGNATDTVTDLKKVCVNNNTLPKKDKDSNTKRKIAAEENVAVQEVAWKKKLSEFLSEEQIERIGRVCEVTEKYVDEKINIMKKRKPDNAAGFLYAALIQNYLPPETVEKKERGPRVHPLIRRARHVPLNREEFEELDDEDQQRLKKVEHVIPEREGYELSYKPQDGVNALTRVIFDNMEIGNTIEVSAFLKLLPEHRKYFSSVKLPAEVLERFHLRD